MLRLLPVLFLLLGAGLLAGSGYAAWSEMQFRRGAVETEGQIVEMLTRSSRRDGRVSYNYVPVFAFSLPDGTKRLVEGSIASNPPCCTVGERVRVRYRPDAPERAQMTGFMESWFVATLLGGIGSVFLLLAWGVRHATRRGPAAVALPMGTAIMPPPASPPAPPPAPFGGPPGAMTFQVPLVGLRREQGAGGTTQFILQARWADPRSGVQRLFESLPIPFDPVPQMRSMNAIAISFDPGNPNSAYAMDLSFLHAPGAGQSGTAGQT